MKRFSKLLLTASALALTLFTSACDSVTTGSQAGDMDPSPMVVMSTTGQRFTMAWEWNPAATTVTASIGPAGGVMALGRNMLWVSPGAVSENTRFVMARDPSAPLRVRLSAGRNGENDVGDNGFAAPVKLGIYYGNAAELPTSLETMQLVYFRPDGLVEPLESQVRVYENLVVADLPHFSLFGAAWP